MSMFLNRFFINILLLFLCLLFSLTCPASEELWNAAYIEDWDQFVTLLETDPNQKLDFSPSPSQPSVYALVKEKHQLSASVPKRALEAIDETLYRTAYKPLTRTDAQGNPIPIGESSIERILLCNKDICRLLSHYLAPEDFYSLRRASLIFLFRSDPFEAAYASQHLPEVLKEFFGEKSNLLAAKYQTLPRSQRKELLLDIRQMRNLKNEISDVSDRLSALGAGPNYGCFFNVIKNAGLCFVPEKLPRIVYSCIGGGLFVIGSAATGYIASTGNVEGAGLVGGITGGYIAFFITTTALNCKSLMHQKKVSPLNTQLNELEEQVNDLLTKWSESCGLVFQQL